MQGMEGREGQKENQRQKCPDVKSGCFSVVQVKPAECYEHTKLAFNPCRISEISIFESVFPNLCVNLIS